MFSLISLTFVLMVVFFSEVGNFRTKQAERVFLLSIISIFSLIISYRNLEIPDTQWYVWAYNDLDVHSQYSFSLVHEYGKYGFEYGFLWLMILFKKYISNSYKVFFGFITFFVSLCIVYSSSKLIDYSRIEKKSIKKECLILGIYMSYFGLYYCGITIRGGIALGLIMVSIVKALEKRYIPAIVLFFLSFSMQKLSIVGILFYIIMQFSPKIKKCIFLVLWITIGFLFLSKAPNFLYTYISKILEILFSKFSALDYIRYLKNVDYNISSYTMVLWILGLVLVILIYEKENLYKLFNVYFAGMIIILFMSTIPGFSRISDFLIVANIPLLHECYAKRKYSRLISIAIITLATLLNMYKVLVIYNWV